MSLDKRETVLAALFAALETVHEVGVYQLALVDRNGAEEVPEAKRPALRMWDGDEVPSGRDDRAAERKAPPKFRAQPAIWGYVRGEKDEIGPALNALLARVRKAYLNNAALITAVGAGGSIGQESLITGLGKSKKVDGHFGLILNIDYVINPASP